MAQLDILIMKLSGLVWQLEYTLKQPKLSLKMSHILSNLVDLRYERIER